VEHPIELGVIPAHEFFDASLLWLGRGKEYRLLAEQLDIVNWYHRNKHVEYGTDYCDGLLDASSQPSEYTLDEARVREVPCRPDRYRIIQEQELLTPEIRNKATGEGRLPASSLGLARLLKHHLTRRSRSRIPFEDAQWLGAFNEDVRLEQGALPGWRPPSSQSWVEPSCLRCVAAECQVGFSGSTCATFRLYMH
jgi:hypothetical protein